MFGRLFRLFLLAAVVYTVARWLLNRRQRQSLRAFFVTLAQALIISSAIFLLLYALGFHTL